MTASIHQLKAPVADPAGAETATPLSDRLQGAFSAEALALLDRFLDAADDRLFRQSGCDDQAGALDAMRLLRTERPALRQRFAAAVAAQLRPGWRPHAIASTAQSHSLRLIDDRVMEERLALQTTCQRLENSCAGALFDLKNRLEAGRRRFGLRLLDVQFAPTALCLALAEALRSVELDVELLVVVLKIFEQAARDSLEASYAVLNRLLGEHGLGGEPVAAQPAPAARGPAQQQPAAALPADAASLAIRAIAANAGALESLLRLHGAAAPASPLDSQLHEAIDAARGGAKAEWAEAVLLRAAATSWLVDDILVDSKVPSDLRDGLESLRGPLARASLVEDNFIRDAEHPLRKLARDVATLAATARIVPPKEQSGIRDFITEMGFTLERELPARDLRATAGVDERTVQCFSETAREAGAQRRNALVRRATEIAGETVARAVERQFAGASLPEKVTLALEKGFGPLLGLVLLRTSRGSAAFTQALGLLEEFVAAIAHGVPAGAAGMVDRIVGAASSAGLSGSFQNGIRALLQDALDCAPVVTAAAGAAAARHDPWNPAPGLEVGEISCGELESCARELFVPGNWFRLRTQDEGGAARWMQVEHCDVASGQVAFADAFGRRQAVRRLHLLVFELVSGQCEPIGCSRHGDRAVSRLQRTLTPATA